MGIISSTCSFLRFWDVAEGVVEAEMFLLDKVKSWHASG